jgi:glucose/arabinose dehydrogenase
VRSIVALVALLVLIACSAVGSTSVTEVTGVEVRLEELVTLDRPLALATRPGDPFLYVAEQGGRVVAFRASAPDPRTVLDLTARTEASGEQGLLGLAFSSDGSHLYVDFTDLAGDTHVVEYAMRGGRADAGSAREVLFVDQPYANHNGGGLVFGPDGFLYIGLGDGGGAGDPEANGQSLGTLLGKLLRIDPRPAGGEPYTVPTSNPFVDRPGARPEIWAYGLRNPWRFSFDRETHDLWIADVGQADREEIDRQPATSTGGENYGWNAFEGTRPFSGSPRGPVVSPVYEYDHGEGGCAIAGGYVYRGSAIPALQGAYVFADVCIGQVEWIRLAVDGGVEYGMLATPVAAPASFGQDAQGEVYVLSLDGAVCRLAPA